MKMKSRFASLLVVLLASAPLLSAGEVERLRALVAEQEMQIQQLELKVAQLSNSPTPSTKSATPDPVSEPATPPVASKAPSEDGLIPIAETCPDPATTVNPETYTIQAGDNMASIARKHGITSATLNKINGLKSGELIRPGQKLKLPAAPVIASAEAVQTLAPVADPTPVSEPATPTLVSKASSEEGLILTTETHPEPTTTENPETYTIQAGDNMGSIARKHGTTSATLNKINDLKSNSIIRPGQKLKLPPAPIAASAEAVQTPVSVADPEPVVTPEPKITLSTPTLSSAKHTVAHQETFYSIAVKHSVTVDALIMENPSINPSTLRIGQVVQIPGKQKTTDLSSPPPAEDGLSLSSQSNIPVSSQSSTVNQRRAADKPIKISREISYSDFAKNYNTTPARLDQLNGLRLDPTTILAQGSELYIPAQP